MGHITIEPLTRVEGHGRVTLHVEDGRLLRAQVEISESPRLFEGLLLGRSFAEVPALVCRICAICSSVHRIAAAGAMERALGVEIPPLAAKVRELVLLGGHIESHALHLFCLVLPDFSAAASILDLLRAGDTAAAQGLSLKALGNRLQKTAGGRTIHPVNIEVGGIVQSPAASALEELLPELAQWQESLPDLLAIFSAAKNCPPAAAAVGRRLSVAAAGEFSLSGEALALSDGGTVAAVDYRQLLQERPVAHSNARQSGDSENPFLSGALARLENARQRGLRHVPTGPLPMGIYGNNAAQGLEIGWALERSRELIGEILDLEGNSPLRAEVRPGAGVGTEAIEAPRGLLIHHYGLDDFGRVAYADIVTPTAINQAAMAAQLQADLDGVPEEEMRGRAERIIRAFDPCISCSVHVMKQS